MLFAVLVISACNEPDEGIDGLVINEIVASNSRVNTDEDGDYPDWIELYNYGENAVNLHRYGLSDNVNRPFKWVFPDTTIDPGEFMLVWASNKEGRKPGDEMHTGFAISAAGEEVVLTEPDGKTVDIVSQVQIQTDYSYGRKPDGTGSWIFFSQPTPHAPNVSESFNRYLDPVRFSHDAGFHTGLFELELTHSDRDVIIYYTLDGSEPDEQSSVYNGPIPIFDRSPEPYRLSGIPTNNLSDDSRVWKEPLENIKKATVLRVKAGKPGSHPALHTRTFFVFPGGNLTFSLPVFSIATDSVNFFSNESGIYVPGTQSELNYDQRGIEWEREASLEFFETDGSAGFAQNAGLRIHGGWSRGVPQKSLRVYARNEYGSNSIDYALFPDEPYA
ncbi:MAG: lamin tail domain-containing protein, partial [Rhodothermaceae bacterium]|nr:lamin tail domain-containing protein [Rhodothermaceae bacterium]